MAYRVGDTVLCPPHGRAVVEAIEPRRVRDQELTYVVLRVADTPGLVVRVPVADLERRRSHRLPDRDELAQVLTVLRTPAVAPPSVPWAQQCREHAEALASGDVLRIAGVLRALTLRGRVHSLTRSECRMLAKARQTLVTRLVCCAEGAGPEEVQRMLADAIAESNPGMPQQRLRERRSFGSDDRGHAQCEGQDAS